jgi:two-component system LytT family sensor kinase
MWQRWWIRWALALLCWTFIGLFFSGQTYLSFLYAGWSAPTGLIVKFNLIVWYLWGLLTPGIVWFGYRFPIEERHPVRNALLQVVAGIFIAPSKWWLDDLLRHLVLGLPPASLVEYVIQDNLLIAWIIMAATQAYIYHGRCVEGEIKSAQLSSDLAQAELQTLRAKLHPHFLFNTLNSIAALIHKDPKAADRMVARLSDLLRGALQRVTSQEVPLAEELRFLEHYLEIERVRFSDRLQIQMDIAPGTLRASIPSLSLQPLVENAIRHGIAHRSELGSIVIRALHEGEMLILEVQDNGPGIKPGVLVNDGVGLSTIRGRLEKLYGAEQRFELSNIADGGFKARIAVPFHIASCHTDLSAMEAD